MSALLRLLTVKHQFAHMLPKSCCHCCKLQLDGDLHKTATGKASLCRTPVLVLKHVQTQHSSICDALQVPQADQEVAGLHQAVWLPSICSSVSCSAVPAAKCSSCIPGVLSDLLPMLSMTACSIMPQTFKTVLSIEFMQASAFGCNQ